MPILCWFCKIWGGEKGKLQEKAGTLSKAAGFSTVYFQPFAVACFCMFQRKNKCFEFDQIKNKVRDNIFFC